MRHTFGPQLAPITWLHAMNTIQTFRKSRFARSSSLLFIGSLFTLVAGLAIFSCESAQEATSPPLHRIPLRVALRNIDTLFLLRQTGPEGQNSDSKLIRAAGADYDRLVHDLAYSGGWHKNRISANADVVVDIPFVSARARRDAGENYYVPHYYLNLRTGELGVGGEWCFVPETSRAILRKYLDANGASGRA
jgi:hypothetical protein